VEGGEEVGVARKRWGGGPPEKFERGVFDQGEGLGTGPIYQSGESLECRIM